MGGLFIQHDVWLRGWCMVLLLITVIACAGGLFPGERAGSLVCHCEKCVRRAFPTLPTVPSPRCHTWFERSLVGQKMLRCWVPRETPLLVFHRRRVVPPNHPSCCAFPSSPRYVRRTRGYLRACQRHDGCMMVFFSATSHTFASPLLSVRCCGVWRMRRDARRMDQASRDVPAHAFTVDSSGSVSSCVRLPLVRYWRVLLLNV
jgi:hypothetical protein